MSHRRSRELVWAMLCVVLMLLTPRMAMPDALADLRMAVDDRPLVRASFGVRSVRVLAADQLQIAIGLSCTRASGNWQAYRVVSFDDPEYAYEKFRMPKAVKTKREQEAAGVEGSPFHTFERTIAALTLPTAMQTGATYYVIAQGAGSEMITGARTAASVTYTGQASESTDELAVDLAVLGLRQVESVGSGVIRLEFGPDFAIEAGSKVASYDVTVNGKPVAISGLGRISKVDTYLPVGWPFPAIPMHEIFLQLPQALAEGDAVHVSVAAEVTTAAREAQLAFDARRTVSRSIKVNQIGYLPGAGVKSAYLGRWMGSFATHTAGAAAPVDGDLAFNQALKNGDAAAPAVADAGSSALRFAAAPTFSLVDDATGKVAYSGQALLVHRSGDMNEGLHPVDYSGENVYTLDFANFNAPGRYFISVPGVGRSIAFTIGDDVYAAPFAVQSYGVFAQRCGIKLGPPYSAWHRIACHTRGLVATTQNTIDNHEIEQLANHIDPTRPEKIALVGGHHDAGDYNPRSHADVAQVLMDTYEIAPQKFYDGQLNIPENHNGIPDILDEAKWSFQAWEQLQDTDGGVFDGTESDGDPNFIQTVELDPKGDFAFAKDAAGSFQLAGLMAQASRIWKSLGRDQEAADFLSRGRRAYAYATAHPPEKGKPAHYAAAWLSPKAYAAAELLHTTGEKTFNDDFLAACVWHRDPKAEVSRYQLYDQGEAAWAYVNCPDEMTDPDIHAAAKAAIIRDADMCISGSSLAAYKFVRHPHSPITWGTGAYENFLTTTIWAWKLTGKDEYRQWIIRTCDNTLGANPLGLSWITGLGERCIRAPLHNSRYCHLGEVVSGMQCEGPNERAEGYSVKEAAFPPVRSDFASLYSFVDCHFAISTDEGVISSQVKTMAAFGLLLPDRH